jgi:hypothetical protein
VDGLGAIAGVSPKWVKTRLSSIVETSAIPRSDAFTEQS